MNIIRIYVDDSYERGARAEGRAFLGSHSRIIVSGGSFADVIAGISIADSGGNDIIGFQTLDKYGGGRTLAGDVLFERDDLVHVVDDQAYVPITITVCDSDGNVYCAADIRLHNSSGSAI
jgi:hypothetical protein